MKSTSVNFGFLSYALFVILISSTSSLARETDQFLTWNDSLPDGAHVLDEHIEGVVDKAITKLNKKRFRNTCRRLNYRVGMAFARGFDHETGKWVDQFPQLKVIPSRIVTKSNYYKMSIYGQHYRRLLLGRTVNIKGIYIGSDKISHALGMGFIYNLYFEKLKYKKNKSSEESLRKVLEFGIKSEKGLLGRWTTGVFSFADLEANYQGLQFYQNLCRSEKPAFVKKNGKWKKQYPIKISDYILPTFDESFYENHFKKKVWKKIAPKMKQYCAQRTSIVVQQRFSFYKSLQIVTPNQKYLSELIEDNKLEAPQTLDSLCD